MDPRPALIWEPRAFWDVLRLQNTNAVDVPLPDPVEGEFDREHFRNGGRYPIILDHMLVCGVGYTLREFDGVNNPPTGMSDYGACSSVVQKARIQISVPNRQHYALAPLLVNAWQAQPVDDVSMRYSPTIPTASGLHNVYRWDFRPPTHLSKKPSDMGMGLERGAACEFWVGGFLNPAAVDPGTTLPYALPLHMAYHEQGAGHDGSRQFPWNAHARTRQSIALAAAVPGAFPFQPADGLGAVAVAQGTAQEWPGTSAIRAQDFKQQEAARAGYNVIGGFSVHLDQSAYDTELAGDSILGDGLVESIATRIPTRARSEAGSQEWWWRPGAPLALVSPSMGPALVYKLPQPIVLHPGDVIEPRMVVPGAILVSESPEAYGRRIFQVGLSFTGYAAIEGV